VGEAVSRSQTDCLINAIERWLTPTRVGSYDDDMTSTATNNEWTIAYVDHRPTCDFCAKTAVYDAKMTQGPWAFMCDDHFGSESDGRLGLGFGQRLVEISEVK